MKRRGIAICGPGLDEAVPGGGRGAGASVRGPITDNMSDLTLVGDQSGPTQVAAERSDLTLVAT